MAFVLIKYDADGAELGRSEHRTLKEAMAEAEADGFRLSQLWQPQPDGAREAEEGTLGLRWRIEQRA